MLDRPAYADTDRQERRRERHRERQPLVIAQRRSNVSIAVGVRSSRRRAGGALGSHRRAA
jgi:hypothetical protein